MITLNRSDIYAASSLARTSRATTDSALPINDGSQFQSGQSNPDTVTISAAARDMASGKPAEVTQNTYENLASVRRISQSQIQVPQDPEPDPSTVENRAEPEIDIDNFFQNAMQSILDSRMGLDKEKLKEIEAMMEEVAKDESLSPEQKTKKLEELQKLMDQVIEESVEKLKKQVEQQS